MISNTTYKKCDNKRNMIDETQVSELVLRSLFALGRYSEKALERGCPFVKTNGYQFLR